MLEITGTKGTYIMSYERWKTIIPDGETTVIREGKNPPSQWDRFYKNIADHLTKGKPLIITGEWARRPIHIIDLAVQSAKKGCTLKAKYK